MLRPAFVIVLLLLAGCSELPSPTAELHPTVSAPTTVMDPPLVTSWNVQLDAEMSEDGIRITLVRLSEEREWAQLAVSSNCSTPNGRMAVGQAIYCPTQGVVEIVDCLTGTLIFRYSGKGAVQDTAQCQEIRPQSTHTTTQDLGVDLRAGGFAHVELAGGVSLNFTAAEDCRLDAQAILSSAPSEGHGDAEGAVRYFELRHDDSWQSCLSSLRLSLQVEVDSREGGLGIRYWTGSAWLDLVGDTDAEGYVSGPNGTTSLRVFYVATDVATGVVDAVVNHASAFVVVQLPELPGTVQELPGNLPTLPPATLPGVPLTPGVDGQLCRTVRGLVGTIEGSTCVISCLQDSKQGRLINAACILPPIGPPWRVIVWIIVIIVAILVVVLFVVRFLRRNKGNP